MRQVVGQTAVNWELTPKPLLTGMYQPPASALTKSYSEQTIWFPCTISKLYADAKSVGKKYSAVIQACKNKKECTISLASPRAFEETVSFPFYHQLQVRNASGSYGAVFNRSI